MFLLVIRRNLRRFHCFRFHFEIRLKQIVFDSMVGNHLAFYQMAINDRVQMLYALT